MKNYPFLFRLLIGAPLVILTSPIWALIFILSQRSFGKVLKETGENFYKA